MFRILQYNPQKYIFAEIISDIFSIPTESLSNLHKIYDESIKNDSAILKGFPFSEYDTMFHKKFYSYLNSPAGAKIQDLYDCFIKDQVSPLLKEAFVYQAFPSFRIHLPNSVAVSHWHYDSDEIHSHPLWEINFQIPITNASGTNATWIETVPGLKDFTPIEMKYGEFCVFDGNRCTHGNKTNISDLTRISFDFRIMPISRYSPENNNNSVGTGKKFAIGEYYKLFKKQV